MTKLIHYGPTFRDCPACQESPDLEAESAMVEPTIDERIEELREHVKDGYIDTFVTEEALAIIDELTAENEKLKAEIRRWENGGH